MDNDKLVDKIFSLMVMADVENKLEGFLVPRVDGRIRAIVADGSLSPDEQARAVILMLEKMVLNNEPVFKYTTRL